MHFININGQEIKAGVAVRRIPGTPLPVVLSY